MIGKENCYIRILARGWWVAVRVVAGRYCIYRCRQYSSIDQTFTGTNTSDAHTVYLLIKMHLHTVHRNQLKSRSPVLHPPTNQRELGYKSSKRKLRPAARAVIPRTPRYAGYESRPDRREQACYGCKAYRRPYVINHSPPPHSPPSPFPLPSLPQNHPIHHPYPVSPPPPHQ